MTLSVILPIHDDDDDDDDDDDVTLIPFRLTLDLPEGGNSAAELRTRLVS